MRAEQEPVGPPEDAATSFEDLPEDLFGEEAWVSGPATGREREDSADPAGRGRERGERAEGGRPDGSGADRGPATGGEHTVRAGAGRGAAPDEDPILDAVGRLFPGRIVGIDAPASDDEPGSPGPSADDEGDGDAAMDEDDGRPSADGGPRASG